MTARERFEALFGHKKCILGMLHLKGETDEEILERAKREIDIYMRQGLSAVIVENYFKQEETKYAEKVLRYLQSCRRDVTYGVNMLEHDREGFEAANAYDAKFIQLDSVAGHLYPQEDVDFGRTLENWRANTRALVFGGVRFKYQPYHSGRSLKEDLALGMVRSDAIVVTGEGTGMETSIDKVKQFRELMGDFPLIVEAGMTPENAGERLRVADGAIVGSYFKDNYKDNGDVDEEHVRRFMEAVERDVME